MRPFKTHSIFCCLPVSSLLQLRCTLYNHSATMTVETRQNGYPTNTVERVATKLPYHEDAAEHITLGILTLFDKLRKLKTLQPDPINGRLFNQLFDLVTISKTTTSQEEKVSRAPESALVSKPLNIINRSCRTPEYKPSSQSCDNCGAMPSTSSSSTSRAR